MGIEYSSVIDSSRDEVFAWHDRPGAIRRLLPPWQPLSVVSEARSLADGRAVLSLPGGLRWVADHQPDEYDPPARFVDALGRDTLTSLPVRLVSSWRHEHRFEPVDDHRTRVTDRVDTPIPRNSSRRRSGTGTGSSPRTSRATAGRTRRECGPAPSRSRARPG